LFGNGPGVAADAPSKVPDALVSPAPDPDPHDEPSIAISPVDNRIMVAASKVIVGGSTDPIRSASRIAYYYSSDAGASWALGGLITLETPQTTYQLASDPTVAADTDGNFYLAVLMGSNSSSGKFDNGIYVFKSSDGGHTFAEPIPVFFDINNLANPKLLDKPYMIIDTSPTSQFKNTIYVAWVGIYPLDTPYPQAIRFAHKRPSDTQFSDQQKISHTGQIVGPAIATGPNGEIYGAWEGHGGPDTILFNASTDGGVTFWSPIERVNGTDLRIHDYVSALDDGTPKVTVPGVRRINSFPTIDVDRSNGPNHGKLYIAWAEPFTNTSQNSDIFLLVMPPPNGQDPIIPNPTRVRPSGSSQFFPSLKVDPQTGVIYIAFYDQFGGGASISPFLTSSSDGGASFAVPTSLSSVPSNPQVQSQIVSANGEGIGIGDYIWVGISSSKLGVVWTDTRDSKQEIFFGGLSFGSSGGGPLPPANDSCSTPKVIGSLPFADSLDTRTATTGSDDPVNCSGGQGKNSVWYSFTATSGGEVGVDTSGSDYDTTLTVYTGSCGALTQVACNDDFGNTLGNRSLLTFHSFAGSTYLIEASGKISGGSLNLRVGYPTVTSIQYTVGPDGNQALELVAAGIVVNNSSVIVQVNGEDNVLPDLTYTFVALPDGTPEEHLFASRRKLKKLIKPGVPVQVRIESPVGSGVSSIPLTFVR
jgi:hypothetical protein